MYTAFLHSIKLSGYKIGIKSDKDALAVEQSNYLTKIVNVYIVYDLATRPRNPNNNLKLKNFLFGASNIVKNSDKEKYVYSGYGITFGSTYWWSFIMALLEMLKFFVLIMFHYYLMAIAKIAF